MCGDYNLVILKVLMNKNAFQWDVYRPLLDHIPAWEGGMYSSMHWVGVYPSKHWAGGVCLGDVCPGGCLPREGVCLGGLPRGCGRHPPPGPKADTPTMDRQTPVKT